MNIAIIQTAFLGDTALSMLFAHQVRRAFQSADVTFVCRPDGASLAAANPAISRTIIYDKRGRDRGMAGIFRIAQQLRTLKVTHTFCLQRSIRTTLVALASGAVCRIGFANAAGAWLLTHRVPYIRGVHEVERNEALLRSVGIEPPEYQLPLPITLSPSQQEQLTRALEQCNSQSHRQLIAIAPGAVWATKRWIPERFVETAVQLQSIGARVVFIGGSNDATLCAALAARSGAISIAGQLDPAATVAFLRHCRLLVSNDSAPTHLATLAACPTITIFGSTVPAFGFAPLAPNSAVVEAPPLECRPCGVHGRMQCPRGTLECMHSISAELVFERARIILNRAPHEHAYDEYRRAGADRSPQ